MIELKRGKANYRAYEQVNRYLKWIEQICTPEEFSNIQAYIVADSFTKNIKDKVEIEYNEKIKLFSIKKMDFEDLV